MIPLLGTTLPVFVGVTLVFMGGCAFMTGQALAGTWRPWWQMLPYGLLMGLGDRFLTFALFHGELLSPTGYVIDSALLIAAGLLSYRLTLARKMVRQYPWAYERTSPLTWRERITHREDL